MRTSSRIGRDSVDQTSRWQFDSFAGGVAAAGTSENEVDGPSSPQSGKSVARQALDEAYKRGLAEGFRAGRSQAQDEFGVKSLEIHDLLASLQAQFATIDQSTAHALTKLAFGLASQVIRHEVASRPEMVADIVQEALAELSHRASHPCLLVNPDDMPFLRPKLDEELKLRGCRLLAEASVARGGCRIVSETSEVDATIASRWERALMNMGYISDEAGDVTTTN